MQQEGRHAAKKTKPELVDLVADAGAPDTSEQREGGVPPLVDVATAAAKRPRDKKDDVAADKEEVSRQTTFLSLGAPEILVECAGELTPVVRISNLTPGITAKLFTDVFSKYGGLVGIHLLGGGAAVMQYRLVESAQCM